MHPSDENLLALRDGEASEEVAAHVSQCPRCASEVERLRGMAQGLRELPSLRPPSDAWCALRPALREGLPESAGLSAVGAVWAALMVLMLGVSFFVLMRQPAIHEDPAVARQRLALREKLEPLQARSRSLESALAEYRVKQGVQSGTTAGTIAYLEDGLAIVDLQLSLFQDDDTEPDTLVRLWQERVKLLSALVEVNATRGAMAQI